MDVEIKLSQMLWSDRPVDKLQLLQLAPRLTKAQATRLLEKLPASKRRLLAECLPRSFGAMPTPGSAPSDPPKRSEPEPTERDVKLARLRREMAAAEEAELARLRKTVVGLKAAHKAAVAREQASPPRVSRPAPRPAARQAWKPWTHEAIAQRSDGACLWMMRQARDQAVREAGLGDEARAMHHLGEVERWRQIALSVRSRPIASSW
jgi:hypothetical protein